jgi:lipid-A-disaccharide synthase
LYHAKPTVVQYSLSPFVYYAVKHLLNVQYMTIANLLTTPEFHPQRKIKYNRHAPQHQHALFPEYPDWRDRSREVASHAIEWLQDEPLRQNLIGRLEALRGTLAIGGASARAAEYILQHISPKKVALPRAA